MYTLLPENFEEKRKKGKCTKVALGKKNSIQIFSKKKKKTGGSERGRRNWNSQNSLTSNRERKKQIESFDSKGGEKRVPLRVLRVERLKSSLRGKKRKRNLATPDS